MNTTKHFTSERTRSFSRNSDLEAALKDLNSTLWICEESILGNYPTLTFPLVLVTGPMRSGTTLLMQWLANTGVVAFPTNLLSRFYHAPIIGAKIQLLLTDPRYNFRDELGEFLSQVDYLSENGKTKGVLAPNEFWYFWRRFLPAPNRDVWSDDELRATMDTRTMLAELAGIMNVFQRPFAAKGMLFNYNIPFLDTVFDKALFVQIKRDPVSNVASVLDARKRQLGSESAWYSFMIREYPHLQELDPVSQVAGQVHYINKAVSAGIAEVSESRRLVVDYERFCARPAETFGNLCQKLQVPSKPYRGPDSFEASRHQSDERRKAIEDALGRFAAI